MSIGLFTEKGHAPTEQEIAVAIGPLLEKWKSLAQWIRHTYTAQDDLKFMYGQKYGWALRFRIRGNLVTALYPTSGGFTAQLILNHTALEKAGQMNLGKNAREAIARAHAYTEGKWLFIRIASDHDSQDFMHLLALRFGASPEPKKRTAHTVAQA